MRLKLAGFRLGCGFIRSATRGCVLRMPEPADIVLNVFESRPPDVAGDDVTAVIHQLGKVSRLPPGAGAQASRTWSLRLWIEQIRTR
jgi:hypothetical protein